MLLTSPYKDEPQDASNTPLGADEAEDLIPGSIRTRSDLNAWEALNIAHAQEWAFGRNRTDPLFVDAIRELHRRMFGDTWKWAGSFRQSDKNISPYHWTQVRPMLHDLLLDTRAQYDASSRGRAELDAIATRFHHRLVWIHPLGAASLHVGKCRPDLARHSENKVPVGVARGRCRELSAATTVRSQLARIEPTT